MLMLSSALCNGLPSLIGRPLTRKKILMLSSVRFYVRYLLSDLFSDRTPEVPPDPHALMSRLVRRQDPRELEIARFMLEDMNVDDETASRWQERLDRSDEPLEESKRIFNMVQQLRWQNFVDVDVAHGKFRMHSDVECGVSKTAAQNTESADKTFYLI